MARFAGTGQQTPAEIRPLTSIRGVAALWVVHGHLIGPILRVLDNSQPSSWLLRNLAHGDQFAVDIFFVLSGYIMIVAYGTRVDASKFYLHRFARVFPLHIVVLAFAVTGFYLLQYQALQPEAYSLANLIFYITLTFVWVGLPPAWNPPSWSLSAEVFAYIFFPFVQLAAGGFSRRVAIFCVCLFGAAHTTALALLGFADTGVGALLRGLLGFCAGALLRASLTHPMPLAPAIGAVAIAVAVVFDRFEYAVPAIFLLIAGLGVNKSGPLIDAMSTRPMVWLGKISYSIYLIHFPLLIGADRLLRKFDLLQSRAGQLIFCLSYIAAVLTISHLSWRFIETPARISIHRWYSKMRQSMSASGPKRT
jgi:peptidoglycan/LPS O-acetylase OafA/YrhL